MYEAQIENLKKARLAQKVEKIKIFCGFCNKEKYIYPKLLKKINFCSKECSNKFHADHLSKLFKGKKVSEETKNKLRKYTGEKSSSWKGGKPKCPDCGKIINYGSKHCSSCKTKYWSDSHLKKIHKATSNKLKGKMPKNIMQPGKYMNIQRGWFDIENKKMFFRSKWEANYALYLNFLISQEKIIKWEYEKDVFIFDKIKLGTRSYRPDFKITNNDGSIEYHEVKGYMDKKSITKLKRMEKYYPDIKLMLIESKFYNDIKTKLGKILKFY